MKFYNYIYAVTFFYFKKLWGKEKEIVPFNVYIALTLSMICFIGCVLFILDLIVNYDFIYALSNPIVNIALISLILIPHVFLFEYKEKYKKVLKSFKKSEFESPKRIFVFLYLFGSILVFIILAIITVKSK